MARAAARAAASPASTCSRRCAPASEHLTRYGGHRAAAGLEIEAGPVDAFRARVRRALRRAPSAEPPAGPARGRRRGRRRREPRPRRRRAARAPRRRSATATRACGCWSRRRRLATCGRWARATATPASCSRAARARALGVAFGVNGSLATAAGDGPARRLGRARAQRVERRGRAPGRARLALPDGSADSAGAKRRAAGRRDRADEFWRRHDAELSAALEPGRRSSPAAGRNARSGSSAAAARRRRRSPRWPRAASRCSRCAPTRSGAASWSSARRARPASAAASSALVSARLADAEVAAAEARVAVAGAGVVLADWAALARDPGLAGALRARRRDRPGCRSPTSSALVARPEPATCTASTVAPRREFALRVHADEWPSRASLAALYRELIATGSGGRRRRGSRARAAAAAASAPTRARPRRPPAGRGSWSSSSSSRWNGSGPNRGLRVVSSSGTDLERSAAFVAYRRRSEEGRRFLSERRQS